jgi:putative NADPH-quinone reductase
MKVLVVYSHPLETSLAAAARDRVMKGLADGGHEARLVDLYADGFDPLLSREEHANHLAPPSTKPDDVQRYAQMLTWCEAIVFVYPTWWSGQPAMLKGWFDRVVIHGVAWDLPPNANRITPLLRNVRRIVAVTSHGSKKYVNALEGEGGKRLLTRTLRLLCHPLTRTTWISIYDIDNATEKGCARHLDRVERRMRTLSNWR